MLSINRLRQCQLLNDNRTCIVLVLRCTVALCYGQYQRLPDVQREFPPSYMCEHDENVCYNNLSIMAGVGSDLIRGALTMFCGTRWQGD